MKKGFTLVELLVVIIILGLLGLVVYPAIIGIINTNRTSAEKSTEAIIIKGAKEWGVEHANVLPKQGDGSIPICISVSDLVSEGYISVTNPKGSVEVHYNSENKQYVYSYYSDGCSM